MTITFSGSPETAVRMLIGPHACHVLWHEVAIGASHLNRSDQPVGVHPATAPVPAVPGTTSVRCLPDHSCADFFPQKPGQSPEQVILLRFC